MKFSFSKRRVVEVNFYYFKIKRKKIYKALFCGPFPTNHSRVYACLNVALAMMVLYT